MDAFISHSSKDAKMVVRIQERLGADGLQVWVDKRKLQPGTLLRSELQTAIQKSRVLVLLWSKAAAESRWVAAEVLTAFHCERFVVPCTRDETPLPYFLTHTRGSSACAVPSANPPIRPTRCCPA